MPHVTLADDGDPARLTAAAGRPSRATGATVASSACTSWRSIGGRTTGPGSGRPSPTSPCGAGGVVGRGGLELELAVTEGPAPTPPPGVGGRSAEGRPLAVTARREGRVAGRGRGVLRAARPVWATWSWTPRPAAQGVGGQLLAAFAAEAAGRGAIFVTVVAPGGGAAEILLRGRGSAGQRGVTEGRRRWDAASDARGLELAAADNDCG